MPSRVPDEGFSKKRVVSIKFDICVFIIIILNGRTAMFSYPAYLVFRLNNLKVNLEMLLYLFIIYDKAATFWLFSIIIS